MRVYIWVHKDEVIEGKIIEYYQHLPIGGYMDYVQVSITVEEFVQLEDNKNGK